MPHQSPQCRKLKRTRVNIFENKCKQSVSNENKRKIKQINHFKGLVRRQPLTKDHVIFI